MSDERRRSRDDDDDRGGRRRERDDDNRRSRDDDEPRARRSRDDDDDDRRRSRDDDDRGERGHSRSRDDDDDRGSSGYRYERRDDAKTRERAASGGGDFDRIVKEGVKMWKPNDRDNRIRIVPPTWKKAEHYGYDLYVSYGVGADRQSYLSLHKMLGKPDPIWEAYEEARRELNENEGDKDLEKYVKDLKPKHRVGVFLVDRDHEKEGVQFWAMPDGFDKDLTGVMSDKSTGEVLAIDDPDEGYDVEFTKTGSGIKTEYTSIAIARRSSPLGKKAWLEYAVENPIPEILKYYDYDHIARAFGGGGKGKSRDDDRDDDRRGRDRDRDDKRSSRDRDDDRRSSRRDDDDDRGGRRGRDDDDDRRRSRDDDDRGGRRRSRDDDDEPTWASVHGMTRTEMEDLIELKRLDIKPKEAKDDDDLADWICEEMKLKKAPKEDRKPSREDDESDEKLAAMRKRRERD